MSLVDQAFSVYLSRITPPETEMRAARRSHNAVRAFLQNDDYFGPMIVNSFLNGSYARNTVVRPIKDVDIIVVVGLDWLKASPASAMESLRRKLAQRYDERRTQRQRRAVRITLYDMQLDVLLAVAPGKNGGPLRIPDRDKGKWIETHPKAQLEFTKRMRTATAGNYGPLVRLLKWWSASRVAAADRPSSFVLECVAYHAIAGHPKRFSGSLANAFASLLSVINEKDFGRAERWLSWHPFLPDPALTHLNVAERWTAQQADRLRAKLQVSLRRIAELERSRSQDTEVKKWKVILGEPFPSSPGACRWRE